MEKGYKNIWVLFLVILLILFWGFFRSYISHFPVFPKHSIAHHIHTALFLSYFLLLFVQPYLIRTGKRKTHRLLGRLSYLLVPLLTISIFFVTKAQYLREITQYPKAQCIANLIIPLPQLFLFLLLYILALVNIRNTAYHMRYMIGTSLVLIGPGIGRVFIAWMGMNFSQAVQASFLFTELVLAGLILYDRSRGYKYKPYLVLLILFILSHILWYFLPQSSLWQKLCGAFADLCF